MVGASGEPMPFTTEQKDAVKSIEEHYELQLTGDISDEALISYSRVILEAFKNDDYKTVAAFVHTTYGVVFSPYATVNLASNQVFTASQVAEFKMDNDIYVWGVYDGVGNPIELEPGEYVDRFVYNRDFLNAGTVAVDEIVKTGNSLENVTDIFPDARFVDFYVKPTSRDGLDWASLRLGFEQYNDVWMLSFVIHSEWTS
jgi:hypothetical protein